MKEHYDAYKKATMQNGGEPLLKKTKEEVVFDPSNIEHMEAVRVLFFPDENSVADKEAKQNLPFRFKVEAPYHDVRTMVYAKVMVWAIGLHRRRMGKKLTVLKTKQAVA